MSADVGDAPLGVRLGSGLGLRRMAGLCRGSQRPAPSAERARSERPRSRAAEKRDELAPPHGRLRRRCCFRFLHLAFWVLLSFARDALVHL
jgi:hypothetical protein